MIARSAPAFKSSRPSTPFPPPTSSTVAPSTPRRATKPTIRRAFASRPRRRYVRASRLAIFSVKKSVVSLPGAAAGHRVRQGIPTTLGRMRARLVTTDRSRLRRARRGVRRGRRFRLRDRAIPARRSSPMPAAAAATRSTPPGRADPIGPNLDDANPSFDEVVAKVKSGGGGMPSFEGELSEQEIRDVAAFVSGGEAGPGGGGRLRDQAVQAEHRAARGMSRRRLPPAGIRKHRVPRRPESRTRTLREEALRGCRRGRLSPDRAHDRRRLAPALRRERRQGARRRQRDLRVRLLPRPPGVEARGCPEGPGRLGRAHRLRPDEEHGQLVRLLPVRPRARPRADALHAVRPSRRATALPPAGHRLRPRLVQRRSLHGEPAVLLRHHLAVAEEGRPALSVRDRLARRQDVLLPARDVADPPAASAGTGRRRRTGAARARRASSSCASSRTGATRQGTHARIRPRRAISARTPAAGRRSASSARCGTSSTPIRLTSAPPAFASSRSRHTGPTARTGSARSSPSSTALRTRSGPTAGGSWPAGTTRTACAARTPSRT